MITEPQSTTAANSVLCVIAGPRAGTTALGKTLGNSNCFHNFGEIFHTEPHYRANWPNIFLNFAAEQKLTLADMAAFADFESIARGYFDYLAQHAGAKKILVDIKFNAWQVLRPAWTWLDEEPPLMRILKRMGSAFVYIRRRDLTEQVLSVDVARKSRRWHGAEESDLPQAFVAPIMPALEAAERIVRAEMQFSRFFEGYPSVHAIAYEDLYNQGMIASDLLDFLKRSLSLPALAAPPVQIEKNAGDKQVLIQNYFEIKEQVEALAKRLCRPVF